MHTPEGLYCRSGWGVVRIRPKLSYPTAPGPVEQDALTACLRQAMPPEKAVSSMNDLLLTWKTKGLPKRLRGAKIEALQDFCIQLEKSVLMYDKRSKKWNDAAQAKIAKGEDASSDRDVAILLAQRKTILLAILKTTKYALAARRRGR